MLLDLIYNNKAYVQMERLHYHGKTLSGTRIHFRLKKSPKKAG